MTTIYVVTQGEYSDYRIVAVYDTKDAAEYHAEHLLGEWKPEDVWVEEYELNPQRAIINDKLLPLMVTMTREGDTSHIEKCDVEDASNGCVNLGCHGSDGRFYVLARNEQHAVKIANERRTRLIADGIWDEAVLVAEYSRCGDSPGLAWSKYASEKARLLGGAA
jgi:hypothetical protein